MESGGGGGAADGSFTFDDNSAIVHSPVLGSMRKPQTSAIYASRFDAWRAIGYTDFWGSRMDHPSSHRSYRPITVASFALQTLADPAHLPNPRPFLIANIALHLAASLLAGVALAATLGELVAFHPDDRAWIPHLAAAVALVFALHPLHTEAVASVVGRAESLAAIGMFGSATAATAHRHSLAIGLGLAGALAKESGVMVLALNAALALWRRERWLSIAAHIAAAAAMVVLTRVVLPGSAAREHGLLAGPPLAFIDNPIAFESSVIRRTLSYMYIHARYLALMVAPVTLSADYSYNVIPPVAPTEARAAVGVAVYAALAAMSAWVLVLVLPRRRLSIADAGLVVGLGWLVVPFLPASSAVATLATVIGERLAYTPLAGFLLLAASVALRLRRSPIMLWTLVVVAVALCVPRTRTRIADWRDNRAVFSSVVREYPAAAKALLSLGVVEVQAGNRTAARPLFEAAIKVYANYSEAHYCLGKLALELGDVAIGQRHLERALAIERTHAGALFEYGTMLAGQAQSAMTSAPARGKELLEQAKTVLRRAIKARPSLADGYVNLATAELLGGDAAAAVPLYRQALVRDPLSVSAHVHLALALVSLPANDAAEACTLAASIPRLPGWSFSRRLYEASYQVVVARCG
ncbi:transmembrane and TPR repeat-containing protein [Thecamonas trahens ATCC 50062]|uniref:dolichyl-phosphate-mannose--protein mannosyltransferase n=1 Tax=Thecamonas trahens ATCC 50062 TaxID=461836 RepID=A0A0L0DUR2_THETB|nr:transmembrane and TPR repeat-containing protein [Thecamonas trahens ATCC 50062]KNC55238.1 transmembrane and TPR repeat-containing protein [Thecamonas trahens ATCC 50062]|eukprot:XP_013753167.1 transmembrane and TPR repeat-containing protein [Thecamonas trahens ATCC 50062]